MSTALIENSKSRAKPPAGQPRVLLVDDDRDIIRGVAIRLRAERYQVLLAHDGKAGLAVARAELPHAIVLDMRMPVMDGIQVLQELRKSPDTVGIPVVVLSASVMDKGKSRALDLGARYFLEKPFDARRLLEALRAAMAGTGES